jgi:hypothetical protein
MAHFAKLDNNNNVLNVIVVNNDVVNNLPFPDSETIGIEFLINWSNGYTNWKQTSYNANFRKNFANIGYIYDANKDAFIPKKPFNSWILNEDTCNWESPIPYPQDNNEYIWNEQNQSWDIVEV